MTTVQQKPSTATAQMLLDLIETLRQKDATRENAILMNDLRTHLFLRCGRSMPELTYEDTEMILERWALSLRILSLASEEKVVDQFAPKKNSQNGSAPSFSKDVIPKFVKEGPAQF